MTPWLSLEEKVNAGRKLGRKPRVHLGFALISRIYDCGANMDVEYAVIRREYKWAK